jgi:AcrR family transcriptional regulator
MCKPPTTAERILDATLTTVPQRGPGKLSMSEVSAAAGVSRPTLYRYYPTKDDLLLALARHEQRRFDEGLVAAVAEAGTAQERLDALLRHLVSFLDAYPGRHLVAVEPGFIVERLRVSLPVQRDAVERLGHDVLAKAPAVRAGTTTTSDLAEVLVRVVMSHFLLPHPDPDILLATLRGIVGVRARGGARARH